MKHKILIVFLFFFVGIELGVSQSGSAPLKEKNLEMYWFYRHRLKEMFMKIGPYSGESIPASVRNWRRWGNNNDFHYMRWGDATITLGHYIGVLATEYRLLANNEQFDALEKTKTELYYALMAMERLDYFGDCTFPYTDACSVNGYFIRDDVYAIDAYNSPFTPSANDLNLPPYNNSFGYPFTPTEGFVWQNKDLHFNKERKLTLFDMDYVSKVGESDYSHYDARAKEMSQDQLIHIMIGLILVNSLLDDGSLPVKDLDGNTINFDFKSQAYNQAYLMMDWARNSEGNPDAGWKIKTPNGDNVDRGHNMATFTTGVNIATNKEFGFSLPNSGYGVLWQEWHITGFGLLNKDNRHMALTTAALSDSWVNLLGMNVTKGNILSIADKMDWGSFYIFLHRLLHDNNYSEVSGIDYGSSYGGVEEIFNSAPCKGPKLLDYTGGPYLNTELVCGGPFPNIPNTDVVIFMDYAPDFNTDSNSQVPPNPCGFSNPMMPFTIYLVKHINTNYSPPENFGWSGGSRFIRDIESQRYGGSDGEGYFNGIDYMLMHNLYYLSSNQSLPFYDDREDRHFSDLVIPFNLFGFNNQDIIGISTLTADNIIAPVQNPANVAYKANDWIQLEPGFSVEAAAIDYVYTATIVDEFECTSGGYERLAQEGVEGEELTNYKNHKHVLERPIIVNDLNEQLLSDYNKSDETTNDNLSELLVSPNPNNGSFTIAIDNLNPNEKYNLSITNLMGQSILSREYSNIENINEAFDFENKLTPGTYLVSLRGTSNIYHQRIVIQ